MNPADQRLETRVWKRIAVLEKAMQDLKTAQPIGADSLSVLSGDITSVSFSLAGGQAANVITRFSPANHKLQMLNFAASVYIDFDLDNNFLVSRGVGRDDEQRLSKRYDWEEWATSADSLGVREHFTLVENNGVDTHQYFYYIRAYYLKGGAM